MTEQQYVVIYRSPGQDGRVVFGPKSKDECRRWKRERDADMKRSVNTHGIYSYHVRPHQGVLDNPSPH